MSKEKCTKEAIQEAAELIKTGVNNKDVCSYLGISQTTFYRWLNKPQTDNQRLLCESLQKAEVQRKAHHLQTITKAADKDWKASAWLLERTMPLEFSLSNHRFQTMVEQHEKDNPRPIIDTSLLVPPSYWDIWRDIMNAGHSTYEARGGRGGLKSTIFTEAAIMLMLKDPKLCGVAFRQVQSTIRDSIFATLVSSVRRLGYENDFEWTYNPLELRRKSTGQKILFRGLDDPEKAKSLALDDPDMYIGFAIWEEFNQFKSMKAVRKVEQTIKRGSAPNFRTLRMWNTHPDAEHWSNQHWEESLEDLDTYCFTVNYPDVPAEWLGEEFIKDALRLKATNEEAYLNEYMGKCITMTGRVFENVHDMDISHGDINAFKWMRCGIDWGFQQDPFVFLRVAYDRKTASLYVFDELFNTETLDPPNITEVKRRLSERDTEGMIKIKQDGSPLFLKAKPENEIRADAAGAKDIATWRHEGVNVKGASKAVPVADGIRWLQKRGNIYIDRKKCPLTWAEFTHYRADEDDEGRFLGYPDKDNHTIDAVRYAVFDLIADKNTI